LDEVAMTVDNREQKIHWEHIGKRRPPSHPVIQAYSRQKLDLILRNLGLGFPKSETNPLYTLLEVGAGNGFFSLGLAEHFDLKCLDFSQRMLQLHPFAPGRKIVGDVCRLPFPDKAFDVVFCANLLHHIEDPKAALLEMKRVSSKRVVVIEPNARNPLMALFGLIVPAERGTLRFNRQFLFEIAKRVGLSPRFLRAHGTVLPNKTPSPLLPLLAPFDICIPLGFYLVGIFDSTRN